jgi:hypothetical protein
VPDINIGNAHVDYSIILKPRVKSAMVTGGIKVATGATGTLGSAFETIPGFMLGPPLKIRFLKKFAADIL